MDDIYDTRFVERLFDEMAGTYDTVNFISSFGFCERWRRQLVHAAGIRPGKVVCDLMCGMGECWRAAAAQLGEGDRILALDLSRVMLESARRRTREHPHLRFTLHGGDALANTLPAGCADHVICGFGVKTLSAVQHRLLAAQICRLLKPGGTFSLIEVSVPSQWRFRGLYMFYLKHVIPVVGRVLLGNPENYRMLGVYTERFGDCRALCDILNRSGLQARYHSYFFGCASGVSGVKGA